MSAKCQLGDLRAIENLCSVLFIFHASLIGCNEIDLRRAGQDLRITDFAVSSCESSLSQLGVGAAIEIELEIEIALELDIEIESATRCPR